MFFIVTNAAQSNWGSVAMLASHLKLQTLHHGSCITKSAGDVFMATVSLDVLQRKRAEVFLCINVRNSGHPRTYDEFGMIFEEVYLNGARKE